jgi:hypothetical protein
MCATHPNDQQVTAPPRPARRDGLERIEVADGSTVAALKAAIHQKLGISVDDMLLSKDPRLVSSQAPTFRLSACPARCTAAPPRAPSPPPPLALAR